MPKVILIRTERKFSKCIKRDGLEEWHSVTHAAEGEVLEDETYAMAQEALDEAVRKGLGQAYARLRRGSSVEEIAQQAVGDEEIEEVPPTVDPSWCSFHETKMKKRHWGGYSHKVGNQWCQGHWCEKHNMPFKQYENKETGGTWWSHYYEDPDTGETLWCREESEE